MPRRGRSNRSYEIKRDREEELIHRGMQYSRAIQHYKKFNRYPTRIEDLEDTNEVRFLRKRYKDPITGKDFKLLHYGEAKLTLSNLLGGGGIPGANPIGGASGLNGASGFGGAGGLGGGGGLNGSSGFGSSSGFGGGTNGGFGSSNSQGNSQGSNSQSSRESRRGRGSVRSFRSKRERLRPEHERTLRFRRQAFLYGLRRRPIVGVVSISKKESIRESTTRKNTISGSSFTIRHSTAAA